MLLLLGYFLLVSDFTADPTIFSQDKVYVQHRVKENSELLWDLIANKHACFYIAG